MPFAYELDGTFYCRDCFAALEGDPEPDNSISWTSDWYDDYAWDEYQTLYCDQCGNLLDEYEPEPEDEDYCDCDTCYEVDRAPATQPANLAAYMAAFIKSATPMVAESVGA